MNMRDKPILITGATGFVGRHLIQTLIQNNPRALPIALVRHVDLWKAYEWTKKLEEVVLIEGSVCDVSKWIDNRQLRGLTGIFHLAALVRHSRKNAEEVYETNIEGALNMVRLAARYQCRMIYVSTSGTVGCFQKPEQWGDEHSPYCESQISSWPYYNSKMRAEKECRKLAHDLSATLVILRPPVLLGPGDHRFRATSHLIRYLKRKLPFLLSGGIHFADVRDAVFAMLKAMEHPHPHPVYHLPGLSTTIDQFFNMVEEASGVPPPHVHLPHRLAWILAKTTEEIDRLFPWRKSPLLPDPVVIEMARKFWNVRSRYALTDLGYSTRNPSQTLADTVQWLLDNHPELKTMVRRKDFMPHEIYVDKSEVS